MITEDFIQDELSQDVFSYMSDWYHLAILELTFVKGFKSEAKWMSRRLGISEAEVKPAVDRLLRLGLLKFEKNRLTKSKRQLGTTNKSETNAALIRNQRQILEKAHEALEKFPVQTRSMTAMTMAIDPTKLEQARKLISQFNKQMCQLLEDGEQTAVYTLEVALFPLEHSLTEGSKT